jgi:inositol 3-alpha-galactosyltransferase
MGPNMSALSKQQAAAAAMAPKRAYVTFLAGDGDYWKGVVGLAKGLRRVRAAYPLVVAVLPDVPEEHRRKLRDQGCVVREIEPVYPPESQTQFAMAYYVINYSKLRIWEVRTLPSSCSIHLYVFQLMIKEPTILYTSIQ